MTIDYVDMAVIERVLEMGGGYVLDFSNNSFQKFLLNVVNVDIYSNDFADYGSSKAKRLRCYFDKSSPKECGNVLLHLLRYKQDVMRKKPDADFAKCTEIANKLSGRIKKSSTKDNKITPKAYPKYDQLKESLFALTSITNRQKRGYEFEKFLRLLLSEYNLDPRPSFVVNEIHEQIDGSFVMNGNTYLIEAKYKEKEIEYNDLILFHNKLDVRSFARGVFISYSVVSPDAIKHLLIGKKLKLIIITVAEIFHIIDNKLDLSTIINSKFRRLDEELNPFVEVMNLY